MFRNNASGRGTMKIGKIIDKTREMIKKIMLGVLEIAENVYLEFKIRENERRENVRYSISHRIKRSF